MKNKLFLAVSALLLAVVFTGGSSASAGGYGGIPGQWNGCGGLHTPCMK